MNPQTVNLVIFIEQMAALLAKSIVDLKNVIGGSNEKPVEDILSDADATYQQIIANAKVPVVTANPPTSGPVTPE